jgi:hypothetical protein
LLFPINGNYGENPHLHPVNPKILKILIWLTPRFAIRQFPIIGNYGENPHLHPVNPKILKILIWLTPRFAIRQSPINSNYGENPHLHSVNPKIGGNPDMANATLRYQTISYNW